MKNEVKDRQTPTNIGLASDGVIPFRSLLDKLCKLCTFPI